MSLAARRALLRWSWRMFRRDWRQQLLVLVLLTLTVAGSIFGSVAARSLAPDQDRAFGTATHMLTLDSEDRAEEAAALRELRHRLGPIDVIGHRRVAVPGSVDSVEYRRQDPNGPYGDAMLGLRSGRYPRGGELAVTDGVADSLGIAVGDHVDLDGVDRAVVGIVDNPSDTDDEFALVAPGDLHADQSVVLVRTTDEALGRLPVALRMVDARGDDERTVAAVAALGLAMVVSILVCLVAAAGFVVIAHRRLRQLGMLASIGATERHLRLVVLANGLVVGAVAALTGAGLAAVAWLVAAPSLERAAGHRLDRFDVPWWIVASGMGLALVTAAAAAWWPGRTVARIPVHLALSSRPPGPRPVHRSVLAATALVVAGFVALALGLDPTSAEANVALVLPGIAALVVGVLLVSPLAVKLLGPIATRLPVAGRLALRDLARNQARSGIALAAITLSLGLAVTTVIIAGATEHTPDEGNLSDRQLLVRLADREPVIPEVPAGEVATDATVVERFATEIDAAVLPLQVAITTSAPDTRDGVLLYPLVVLGRPAGDVIRDIGALYVATPPLARRLGVDLDTVGDRVDVLTSEAGPLRFANTWRRVEDPVARRVDRPAYAAGPSSLITPAAMARHGWTATPAGWFLEADEPLSDAEITAARAMAVDAGLTIESRDRQASLGSIRAVATGVGMALALAILAMTVGLMRGEAANEVRTLAATGARAGTRRTIVAVTAGALALLGVLIGTAGAYLALVAGYLEDLAPLARIPVAELLVTVTGVPLLAAGVGWLLAGREPPLTRPAID